MTILKIVQTRKTWNHRKNPPYWVGINDCMLAFQVLFIRLPIPISMAVRTVVSIDENKQLNDNQHKNIIPYNYLIVNSVSTSTTPPLTVFGANFPVNLAPTLKLSNVTFSLHTSGSPAHLTSGLSCPT